MKRKKLWVFALVLSALLSACGNTDNDAADITDESAAVTESNITEITEKETTMSFEPLPIKPLSPSKKQSYFENDEISVTAELKNIDSMLYYPEIIAEMGADPDRFVAEISVRVKNISHENISFDVKKLALLSGDSSIELISSEEAATDISSGKTVTYDLKALCRLKQARDISGFSYNGELFEAAEIIVSDKIREYLDTQSADDVRTYLYKKYITQRDYSELNVTGPAMIFAQPMGRTGDNGEYLAVRYHVTNRSDYALIIDPSGYSVSVGADNENETELEPLYISTDKKLMYEAEDAGTIKGIGKVYEVPEFICTYPDRETVFTMIYKVTGYVKELHLYYTGNSGECYAQYDKFIGISCDYPNEECLNEEKSSGLPIIPDQLTFSDDDTKRNTGTVTLLDDDILEYKNDSMAVTMNFTGAESLKYHPDAMKIPDQGYDESGYVLHSTFTVENLSSESFDFIPQKVIISGQDNSSRWRMNAVTHDGTTLICSDGYYTIDPGKKVTFDIDFVGDRGCIEYADKIEYAYELKCRHNNVDYKTVNTSDAVKDFYIESRTDVKKAVGKALEVSESTPLPYQFVQSDGEYTFNTDNNSYCADIDYVIPDGYVIGYMRVKLKVHSLTGKPEKFEPKNFTLDKTNGDLSHITWYNFDEALADHAEAGSEVVINGKKVVFYNYPFGLYLYPDGTAEYEFYFNYKEGDEFSGFSYFGANDTFEKEISEK